MTKKSTARQRRDLMNKRVKEEGVGQTWDELENVYQTQSAMFSAYAEMGALIINPGVMPYLATPDATKKLMKGLTSDVRALRQELEAIHAEHNGKTGAAVSSDDFFAVTMLHEKYYAQMVGHEQTVLPIMAQLNEHINIALTVREALEKDALERAAKQHEEAAVEQTVVEEQGTEHV